MSAFREAAAAAGVPIDLMCPKCGAMNRPGATIIERQQDGSLFCGVCSHHWKTETK